MFVRYGGERTDRSGAGRRRLAPPLHPRRLVGGVLVERLGGEQRGGQGVQPLAVLAQQLSDRGVRLLDDPPHLLVDDPLRRLDTWEAPGSSGFWASLGITAIGPISRLMPQRPTIWRAIMVSCWMSDSAPALIES